MSIVEILISLPKTVDENCGVLRLEGRREGGIQTSEALLVVSSETHSVRGGCALES